MKNQRTFPEGTRSQSIGLGSSVRRRLVVAVLVVIVVAVVAAAVLVDVCFAKGVSLQS